MKEHFEYKGIKYYKEGHFFKIELDGVTHTYLGSGTVKIVIDNYLKERE